MRISVVSRYLLTLSLAVLASVSFAPAETPSPFTEEAVARGLTFLVQEWPQVEGGQFGQGIAWVDLDNDGDSDLILIGKINNRIGVYENTGGGNFVDQSLTSGIPVLDQQEGVTAADYDGDGLLDLYFTQFNRPNVLMRNLGNFVFEDKSDTAGVDHAGWSMGASWGDFNGDGWLDLYVNNYTNNLPGNRNVLYQNNGDGTFTDVSAAQGVNSDGLSFQSVWSDIDRDGDLDLYVSNDRGPQGFPANELWRNDNGTMVDISAGSGADVSIYSMGLAAGDVDANGYTDFYLTNLNGTDSGGGDLGYDGINPLLLNQGNNTFVDDAENAGVANHTSSWGATFLDFDNNSHTDLYVNNQFVENALFSNTGTFPCVDVGDSMDVEGELCPDAQDWPTCKASFTAATADIDGDGDVDIMIANLGTNVDLFINNEGSKKNHLRYNVIGEYPNLFAVGAGIEATVGSKTQFYEIYAGGNGYLGHNELQVHLGLDDAAVVDQSVVRWPSGGPTRVLTDLPANNTWDIYPPSRLCDEDGGGVVDNDDFVHFAGCFSSGFVNGCEMMDFDGDSGIGVDDLDDCFVTTPSDCNGNGTEDLVEIMLDLGLDGDDDGAIDCCSGGSTPYPNGVGATLLLGKNGSDVDLSWGASPVDASHDPATSYDVFRSSDGPLDGFGVLANVGGTAHTDAAANDPAMFYLIGARNGCGSSGDEPF